MTSFTFKNNRSKLNKSSLARKEDNDCVVKAIMHSFGVTYERAHSWCEENLERQPKQGVYNVENKMFDLSQNGTKFNNKQIIFLGNSPKESRKRRHITNQDKTILINPKYLPFQRAYTVGMFALDYKKGTYFILVQGHALCIKNGIIIDSPGFIGKGLKRPIEQAFQII